MPRWKRASPARRSGRARGLEALTVHIDWISKIVNGAVSVPDGLRVSREAVEKLTSA